MSVGRGATGKREPRAKPVVFRVPPDRLASLLTGAQIAGAPEASIGPEARLRGADVRRLTVRPVARGDVEARKATLRLPRWTPPGRYEGSAQIAGRELAIVAEVQPRARLEAHPSRLSIDASPGEKVTADVTLLNTGNVTCEIAARSTFCLFDGQGIDHAFWAALTSEPPDGKQRVDLLLDDLAGSHGGLVEVTVTAGAGPIEAGESREVRLALSLSDRIRVGHAYAGAWEAPGLRLAVRITVPRRERKRASKAAR
jgi:hypothetical protein